MQYEIFKDILFKDILLQKQTKKAFNQTHVFSSEKPNKEYRTLGFSIRFLALHCVAQVRFAKEIVQLFHLSVAVSLWFCVSFSLIVLGFQGFS